LQVNRNTVVEALNVLNIEGWLITKERQGTFVSDNLPIFKETRKSSERSDETKTDLNNYYHIQLDDGHPNSQIAPIAELARSYRQIFNQKGKWQMMGYSNELGNLAFRKEIAKMLNHQRAMQINEQNICITRGSQMAMYLI